MHFAGGVAIAFFFWTCFRAIPESAISKTARPSLELLFVFSLTATASVIWEFGEYTSDTIFGSHALDNVFDTLQDLAMGLSGAGVFILIVLLLGMAGRVRPIEIE